MATFKRVRGKRKQVNLNKAALEVARTVGKWHVSQRRSLVSEFEHKPNFTYIAKETTVGATVSVYATGPNKKIWFWIDQGIEEQVILPVNAKNLTFMLGYKPATSPGSTTAGAKARSGPVVRAGEVTWSVAARNLDDAINKRGESIERANIKKIKLAV